MLGPGARSLNLGPGLGARGAGTGAWRSLGPGLGAQGARTGAWGLGPQFVDFDDLRFHHQREAFVYGLDLGRGTNVFKLGAWDLGPGTCGAGRSLANEACGLGRVTESQASGV